MFTGQTRLLPELYQGIPKDAMTDLYRAKYGMPLDRETHERFIATKVPYRKNKDNRARFRNYSFGYPTYKKDTYMRHWYNFLDIMKNNEAPLLKYAKIYLTSYVLGTFYHSFGGYRADYTPTNLLESHKLETSSNYLKNTYMGQSLRSLIYSTKGPAASFALMSTFYFWLVARFQGFDYSLSQSVLRAAAFISPVYIFLKYDRPFTNFWYRSFGFFLIIYPPLYLYTCNKSIPIFGKASPNSEKYYFKGVSPQEIAKIEYEDSIQNYANFFEMDNAYNYYDSYNQKTSDKFIFKSPQ